MASYLFDKLNYSSFKNIPGAVYTRSGVEYQQNAEGVWTPFDDDVPPRSDGVGVDVWEARTNSIRNPTGLGAVAGTPGTLPTNWSISGTDPTGNGLTRTLAFGVENGLPYIEVTLAGTPTSTYATGTYFDTANAIPASSGQTWSAQGFAKVIGTPVGVNFQLNIVGRSSGGSGTETFSSTPTIGSSIGPISSSALLANASTAFVHFAVGVIVTSGVPVNVTYRVYAPNLNLGANIGDPPILQTTNAAATRGNPSMYINAPGLLVPPYTVVAWFKTANAVAASEFRRVFSINDGTTANLCDVYLSPGQVVRALSRTSGVQQADFGSRTFSPGALVKVAARFKTDSIGMSVNGQAVESDNSATLAAQYSRIQFGDNAENLPTRKLNGAIQRFQIINRDISDTELVNLTV